MKFLLILFVFKTTYGEINMPITISIPTILRPLTDNQKRIEVDGSSVLDAIERMEQRYPGVKEKLVTGGQAHRFVTEVLR